MKGQFALFLSTTLVFACLSLTSVNAQLTMPAASPEAEVSQRVGITDITVHYNRPYVKDRKIWGELVPYGFNDLGFGTSKSAPWRAGADYNTTIAFTHEVSIQGNKIPAGKYALFMAPEENGEVLIILSSNTTSWGSYYYDVKEDVLRFKVNAKDNSTSTELLTYSFDTVGPTSAVLSLHWEKKEIPFKIEVDVDKIVMAGISNDLRNPNGFQQSSWDDAASYAFNAGQLDKALEWVNASIEGNFFSEESFTNLSLKSRILEKQGNNAESETFLTKAIALGNATQVYRLGTAVLSNGNLDKALGIMQANVKNNDGAFPSNYGLARVYSAKKDFKKALLALENTAKVTPEYFKPRLAKYLEQLKNGEDIN